VGSFRVLLSGVPHPWQGQKRRCADGHHCARARPGISRGAVPAQVSAATAGSLRSLSGQRARVGPVSRASHQVGDQRVIVHRVTPLRYAIRSGLMRSPHRRGARRWGIAAVTWRAMARDAAANPPPIRRRADGARHPAAASGRERMRLISAGLAQPAVLLIGTSRAGECRRCTCGGARGIIGPAASCLKPLPERSASTQECPLRLISRAGRQEGR